MARTETSNTAIEKRAKEKQGTEMQTVNVPDRAEQQQPAPAEAYYTPLVDVIENADAFVFQADLPGVKAEDLDVSFENGALTIEGRVQPRQPQGRSYLWREYGVGHFYRSFNIETPVNADGIKAQLRNGVLELYVPKAEAAKSRKIAISAS
jgi:HSP20 family protein